MRNLSPPRCAPTPCFTHRTVLTMRTSGETSPEETGQQLESSVGLTVSHCEVAGSLSLSSTTPPRVSQGIYPRLLLSPPAPSLPR